MESSPIRYFQSGPMLDQLSVTEIEQHLTQVPSDSIYSLLFAKKMPSNFELNFMLISQDRIMMHYMLENEGRIPSLHDLNNLSTSQSENKVSSEFNYEELETTSNLEVTDSPTEESIIEVQAYQETSKDEDIIDDLGKAQISNLVAKSEPEIEQIDEVIENVVDEKTKIKKKKNKFKLRHYGGISEYAKWLMSFKEDDIDQKIKKEEKAAKKRRLEENAKKSITKSNSIVSEPLAEILANQGHLDDAKKMYEQLMMKYPEKSSYFAAKINLLIKN